MGKFKHVERQCNPVSGQSENIRVGISGRNNADSGLFTKNSSDFWTIRETKSAISRHARMFSSKANRPFSSSLVPLFQNECKCENFLMKMSSARSFIFMQIKVIFIRMVSHLDSLWNRGTRGLGNGLILRNLRWIWRVLTPKLSRFEKFCFLPYGREVWEVRFNSSLYVLRFHCPCRRSASWPWKHEWRFPWM